MMSSRQAATTTHPAHANSQTGAQASAQAYRPDARNEHVLVYVNGAFVPRAQACVSVFDAGYVCGDGVWEGLRLVHGRVVAFDAHIDRVFDGACTIAMDIGLSKDAVKDIVTQTFAVNHMHDGAHARLMVTRGVKTTPNQDPRFTVGKATIVCVAEHKVVDAQVKTRGLRLHTSTIRCSTPDVFDLRLNSHSRLHLIQALIQAIDAGADEALMLDTQGFVSSCNSTNFFMVRQGTLWTSPGLCCFNGITRATVLHLARAAGIQTYEQPYTLAEVYCADEAFVTGTLGGITPVSAVDGRSLPQPVPGALTQRLTDLYQQSICAPGAA